MRPTRERKWVFVTFRLGIIGFCLLLLASRLQASPCASLKSQPDTWVAANVDALCRAARAAYESDKALPAYERLLDIEYVEAASLYRQPDHELGFNVPDEQYFSETRQFVQIPEFLMDQSFLRSVSRYYTLAQAKSFLRRLNSKRQSGEQLIFFSYKSRHLGTPDNKQSYGRLLIVVPGGTFNSYFKDFYRTYGRDGWISINGRWELGEGDDNCAQCHKSGILPIFPVAGSVNPSEQQAVLAVNQRFLTYGSPRFEKYLDATKFGPGLGSASWNDREQRFGANFDETVAARAMSCAVCHQHERLGALNWPMDRIVISSFVKGGQMPLGYELKIVDRRNLYEKLIQRYFATDRDDPGILKSWLLSGSSAMSLDK